MRILHVVPTYAPAWRYGGPIVSVHGLCKGLVRAGHDVHVFTTNVDGPGHLDVAIGTPVDVDGVKVSYFASRFLKRLYWAPGMNTALRREVPHFDLLHLHSVYLWPTAAAASVARRFGKPYVLAPRGMLVADLISRKSRLLKRAWIEAVERRNLAGADAIHFTSRLEEADARKLGLPFRRALIVPNGVEDEEAGLAGEPEPAEETGLLLYIGRINWKKGLDRLISALALVPDCRLLIVGNDEEQFQPSLEALAERHGVRDRVSFAGPIYGVEKTRLMSRAAALVLASYSENFGNVVLEAMAAGCPVIVTPEVGAADLVLASGAGLVAEGAPEKLAAAIGQVLGDRALRDEMRYKGRRAVASRYTWTALAKEMEKAYGEIVQAAGGSMDRGAA